MEEEVDKLKDGMSKLARWVKKYGKKFLLIAKPLLILLLIMALVVSIVGVWSSVTDTLKSMLSQLSSYSKSVWKYITDDYWFNIENKDIEREVRDSDGNIIQAKVSIVEAYLLDLEEKNISVKDLGLIGDGNADTYGDSTNTTTATNTSSSKNPYYNEEKKRDKTVWELIQENSENTRRMKKYVAEFIRAEFITNQIHRRRGNELINPNNENEIDGGVYLYRTKNEDKDGEVSKTEKNIYQMEYTEYEKFIDFYSATGTSYVQSNIEKYYTVAKEDGQLGAIAYSQGDLLYYKVDTKEVRTTTYPQVDEKYKRNVDLTLQTEDYQTLIAEYAMPYEFLIALCQYTQNPEYVYHVARMARKTRIDLLIQDSLTTTQREEVITADITRYVTVGSAAATESSLGNQEIEKIKTTEVVDTPQLIISKVNTWSAALWNRYMNANQISEKDVEHAINEKRTILDKTYTQGDAVASDYAASSGSTVEVREVHKADNIIKKTHEKITINEYTQVPGVDKIRKSKQFLGLLINETGKCPQAYCYNIRELAQLCVEEAVYYKGDEGKKVYYRIPNSTREEAPFDNLEHAEEALCAQLQLTYSKTGDGSDNSDYNEKLQGVEEYIRYIFTFPDNENINLEEEGDWQDLIDDEIYDDIIDDVTGDTASAREIYQFLIGKGMTPEGACGILGNIQRESSFRTNATNGTHFGLCQWGDGRWESLKALAQEKGTKWTDLDTQLEFMWNELCGGKSHVKDAIMDSTDLRDATDVFCRKFEICGNYGTEVPIRYKYARHWYELFVRGAEQDSTMSSLQNQLLKVIENLSDYEGIINKDGMCQAFVRTVFEKIGITARGETPGSATEAMNRWTISSNINKIPVGATVYGRGSGADGHVGIYIGNGMVVHNIGKSKNCSYGGLKGIKCEDINSWDRKYTFVSWGWQGGVDLRD